MPTKPPKNGRREFEDMQESINLSKHSNKFSQKPTDPFVGAVLITDDGERITGFREKARVGEHAEFGILGSKRKVRNTKGSTLFTTLEPCTQRQHDKHKPCSDWIVERGVRKVYIGMLDPNPRITGKGYWHLIDNGIEVEFYPHQLTAQIRSINATFINHHRYPVQHVPKFVEEIACRIGDLVSPFTEGIALHNNRSLIDCPSLSEGWPSEEVTVVKTGNKFELPREMREAYVHYVEDNNKRHREGDRTADDFTQDGVKFMLIENPQSWSDAPKLPPLKVKPTRYSKTLFYQTQINPSKRRDLVYKMFVDPLEIRFSHNFCLHLLVTTADHKLLLTQRSDKVRYEPGTWTVSLEENLAEKDFGRKSTTSVFHWIKRALSEELGIPANSDYYRPSYARVLSIFFEGDHMNVNVCAEVQVNLNSDDLPKFFPIRQSKSERDHEFKAYKFLPIEKDVLAREIRAPQDQYHCSGLYRLLMLMYKEYGAP